MTRLVTAADLCAATETVLRSAIPQAIDALDLGDRFGAVKVWQQVPNFLALTTADFPACAITSPGLTGRPTRRSTGHDATWRIGVGIADRGIDHDDTAYRIRTWAGIIRVALLAHPTLGGLASAVEWTGEEYAQRPRKEEARTLGGCAVAFDVTARNVADADFPRPAVTRTQTTVSVRPAPSTTSQE